MNKSVFCQWLESDNSWTCSQCGAVVPKSAVSQRPFAACRVGAEYHGVPFREVTLAKRDPVQFDRMLNGPGTELKKLLAKFGIKSTATCQCNSHAIQMNLWGPDICEQKIDQILIWLREEAGRKRLPFVDALARMMVRRAIRKARESQSSPQQ